MKTALALVLSLALLASFSGASPILTEKQAKQLLRSRRQDRPSKPGFPDEPMRDVSPCGSSTCQPRPPLSSTSDLDSSIWTTWNEDDGQRRSSESQEYMHHLLRLERRAEEQFLEHWLNPFCKPHCDRNLVHPV